MSDATKYALALAAVVAIIFLLSANLFLMWNIYNKLQDVDVLISRIEKVESQVQMAEALARSASNSVNRQGKDVE